MSSRSFVESHDPGPRRHWMTLVPFRHGAAARRETLVPAVRGCGAVTVVDALHGLGGHADSPAGGCGCG
jgi:hypothetical protein